jgi:hypothetical protein
MNLHGWEAASPEAKQRYRSLLVVPLLVLLRADVRGKDWRGTVTVLYMPGENEPNQAHESVR